MTAFRFNRNDPRVQRKIQRIAAQGDNYAGLVSSLLTKEAGAQMDKYITLARLGQQKEQGAKQLALGEKRLLTKSDISKADIASREKMSELSNATQRETQLANIASREGMFKDRQGLEEDAFKYKKGQSKWENIIAAAGLPVQYGLDRRESAEMKALSKLRNRNLPVGTQVRGRT